jgi:lipid-binding SYLF domain-containing protein
MRARGLPLGRARPYVEDPVMTTRSRYFPLLLLLALAPVSARADKYDDTVRRFRDAGQSGKFFENCYGYAVFPTIGKGGIGFGGAHGSGRVYAHGEYTGDASMTQVTMGFQFGGQAYSQIVFFQDQRAYDEFTHGGFEFSAQATAVAITAGASAQAATNGAAASAGTSADKTKTAGAYEKGMAVFTAAKGGLMYEATIGGQRFSFRKKKG